MSEQRNRAGRGAESAKGVRPNVRTVSLLGLIVAFVVGGAVYAHAAFWADSPAASLLQYVKAEKKKPAAQPNDVT